MTVPRLRFPEFWDAGEWKIRPLDKLINYENGKAHESHITAKGKYIVVNSKFISTEGEVRKYTDNGFCVAKKEDILMVLSDVPNGRAIAKCYLVEVDDLYTVNQRICRIKPNDSIGRFLFYVLNRNSFYLAFDDGVKQTNLCKADVLSCPVFSPSLPEQKKIADCLTSIDDRITAETQKLGTLKVHKKGLMQQLFPAEGETVPDRRFPEFRDAEEWRDKPVKEVFEIFQGYAFASQDSVKNGIRWIKIADVGIHKIESSSPSYLPHEFIEKYQKFLIKEGDYIIALTRPILNNQLKIARANSLCKNALLNQRVGKLLTDHNIDFIYFLMQTEYLINEIEKNISGSEPPNLSVQKIEDISVCIPSRIEQTKIADCLCSLDELITAQTQKIDTLKIHKKGLMQQLFPAIEETIG